MSKNCVKCGNPAAKKCSRCNAPYCGAECQYLDWKVHGMKCIQAAPFDDFDVEPITPDDIFKDRDDSDFLPPKPVPQPQVPPKKLSPEEIYDFVKTRLEEFYTVPKPGEKLTDWVARWPKEVRDKFNLEELVEQKRRELDEYKIRELELLEEWQFSQFMEHETTTVEEKQRMRNLDKRIARLAQQLHTQTKMGKSMSSLFQENQLVIEKMLLKALQVFNFIETQEKPMTPKQRANLIFEARVAAETAFPRNTTANGEPVGPNWIDSDDRVGDEKDDYSKTVRNIPKGQVPIPGLKSIMERLKIIKRITVPNSTERQNPHPYVTMVDDDGKFVVVDRKQFNKIQRETRDYVHDQLLPSYENFVQNIKDAWYNPKNSPFRQLAGDDYEKWLEENDISTPKTQHITGIDPVPIPKRSSSPRRGSAKKTPPPANPPPNPAPTQSWWTNMQPNANQTTVPTNAKATGFASDKERLGQFFAQKWESVFGKAGEAAGEVAKPIAGVLSNIPKRAHQVTDTFKETKLPEYGSLRTPFLWVLAAMAMVLWALLYPQMQAVHTSPIDLVTDFNALNEVHVQMDNTTQTDLAQFDLFVDNWYESQASEGRKRMYAANSSAVIDIHSGRFFFGEIAFGDEQTHSPQKNQEIGARIEDYILHANYEELTMLRKHFTLELLYHHAVAFIKKPSGIEPDVNNTITGLTKLQILRANTTASAVSQLVVPQNATQRTYEELVTISPGPISLSGVNNLMEEIGKANAQIQVEDPSLSLEELREIVYNQGHEYFLFESRNLEIQYDYWHAMQGALRTEIDRAEQFNATRTRIKQRIAQLRQERQLVGTIPENTQPWTISFNAQLVRNESTRHLYNPSISDNDRKAYDDALFEWVMNESVNFPNGFSFFNQSEDDILAYNLALRYGSGVSFKSTEEIEELRKRMKDSQRQNLENLHRSRFYGVRYITSFLRGIVLHLWNSLGAVRFHFLITGGLTLFQMISIVSYAYEPLDENSRANLERTTSWSISLLRFGLSSVALYGCFTLLANSWAQVVYLDQLGQEFNSQNNRIRPLSELTIDAGLWDTFVDWAMTYASGSLVLLTSIANGTFDVTSFSMTGSQFMALYGLWKSSSDASTYFYGGIMKMFDFVIKHRTRIALGLGFVAPIAISRLTQATLSTSMVVNNYRTTVSPVFEYNAGSRDPKPWPFSDDFSVPEILLQNQRYRRRLHEIWPSNTIEEFNSILQLMDPNLVYSPPVVPLSWPVQSATEDSTPVYNAYMNDVEFWKKRLKPRSNAKVVPKFSTPKN